MTRRWLGVAAAVLLGFASRPGVGAAEAPAAADLLFEAPAWRAAPAGTVLSYRYERRTGNEALFGPPVSDRIRLDLDPGEAAETRTVRIAMFTDERRVPAGPFENVGYNPALVLFLEQHVARLAKLVQANPRYLKNAIRTALRYRATITPTTFELQGRAVPGWRVVVTPFAEDPNRARMRGLETLDYTFVAAESVPGLIAGIEAIAKTDDGPLLQETLTYDPDAR
jgi:hypothetical protein